VLPPWRQRSGRGLYMIAHLAARWGTGLGERGFLVWAEIREAPEPT
jgi:hypothetical protein